MERLKKQTQTHCSETPEERRERRRRIFKSVMLVTSIICDVAGVIMALNGAGFTKLGRLVGLTSRTASRSRFLV